MLNPKGERTIKWLDRENINKLFATADAPERSGVNKWRRNLNGLVNVVFAPERADMMIICVAKGGASEDLVY